MTAPEPPSITELLAAAQAGDTRAQDAAANAVYAELRAIADGYLKRERADHTLQPTALVNEAYMRLVGQHAPWKNRKHFFGIAAQMMRRILVDHARRSSATRRDREMIIPLNDAIVDGRPDGAAMDMEILGVHDALEALERIDPRQARVVELRFFVGLSITEIADVMDISEATVSREWSMARAWLHERLREWR